MPLLSMLALFLNRNSNSQSLIISKHFQLLFVSTLVKLNPSCRYFTSNADRCWHNPHCVNHKKCQTSDTQHLQLSLCLNNPGSSHCPESTIQTSLCSLLAPLCFPLCIYLHCNRPFQIAKHAQWRKMSSIQVENADHGDLGGA